MGKGRDKRKKLKGTASVGKGALKTERKTQKNEEKKARRDGKAGAGGEDDIDAILAQLDLESAAKSAVRVTADAPPPGARVNCVWLPNGDQKAEEIVMFGGELFDQKADRVYMYGDIFLFNPAKERWTHVESKGPHPRSACAAAVHKKCLYIFGGEFTSPNQEKFRHFRDLWRLDMATWEWDELPCKGGPSARSGHRMVCHRGALYVFGGYYDTGDDVPKYYNDLWRFDLDDLRWAPLGDMRDRWPAPRSGYQFALHGDRLVLHGGYAKARDEDDAELERGAALDDTWCWHFDSGKWERIARAGMAPSKRASFSMVTHKASAYMFGGVADEEAKGGEVIVSNFFNELYQLNLAQGRWYPVALRPPKHADGAETARETAGLGAVLTDDEARRQVAATRIQAHYRGHVVRQAYKLYRVGGAISEVLYSPAAYGIDLSSRAAPKPRARINANMAVVKNTLWLFGGIVEIGDREVTLDDLWKLDLVKLDGWRRVKDNTVGREDFEGAGDGSSDSDEESSATDDDVHLPRVSAVKKK